MKRRAPNAPLSVLAPAKINIYLHVTGRRDDGYHTLDSLVCFSDIADLVTVEAAPEFAFAVKGPFADAFSAAERDAGPDSRNLAVRAARALAQAAGRDLNVKLTLTKNLPLAAGVGGGSADAAAAVRALLAWWEIPFSAPYLPEILKSLGADVPVCFVSQPTIMRGIGEELTAVPGLKEMSIVLANPGKPCATADVFARYKPAFRAPVAPGDQAFLPFVKAQANDLSPAACALVPEIADVLGALTVQPGAALVRMSGSGATCFGLFSTAAQARAAASRIKRESPHWWVEAGVLNRGVR